MVAAATDLRSDSDRHRGEYHSEVLDEQADHGLRADQRHCPLCRSRLVFILPDRREGTRTVN